VEGLPVVGGIKEFMLTRKLILLISVLVLGIAAAGCPASDSGNDGEAAEVAEVNPCELVSGADVSDATGETFGDGTGGVPAGGLGPAICTFTSSDGSFVSVAISPRASATEAAEIYTESKGRQMDIAGTEPQDVADLGDGAYYMADPQNSLIVLSGAYEISVSMRKIKDSLAQETQLAEVILPQMP